MEHQLCIFHVIKDVNKLILGGVRAIKNEIKAQGNKGRKRKRGKPSKAAQQRETRRKQQGILSKKEEATFIFDNQYLIVRKEEDLTRSRKGEPCPVVQNRPTAKDVSDIQQAVLSTL